MVRSVFVAALPCHTHPLHTFASAWGVCRSQCPGDGSMQLATWTNPLVPAIRLLRNCVGMEPATVGPALAAAGLQAGLPQAAQLAASRASAREGNEGEAAGRE